MSTISKVFTVVNIVLAMFVLGSVAAILSESDDYRRLYLAEKDNRATEVAQLTARVDAETARASAKQEEANDLKNRKNTVESTNARLVAENEDAERQNNGLRDELSQLNTSLTNLTAQYKTASDRREELTAQVGALEEERNGAVDAKRNAEDDRSRLEKDIESLETDIADFETRLTQVTERRDVLLAEREALVALGIDPVMLIGGSIPKLDATVSDVGTGFVVLSVGENDGVQVGFPFDVYRQGTYIGRVVVQRLYPDNCVANVTLQDKDQAFRPNDQASTRL